MFHCQKKVEKAEIFSENSNISIVKRKITKTKFNIATKIIFFLVDLVETEI